jgi:hypothetical protein
MRRKYCNTGTLVHSFHGDAQLLLETIPWHLFLGLLLFPGCIFPSVSICVVAVGILLEVIAIQLSKRLGRLLGTPSFRFSPAHRQVMAWRLRRRRLLSPDEKLHPKTTCFVVHVEKPPVDPLKLYREVGRLAAAFSSREIQRGT